MTIEENSNSVLRAERHSNVEPKSATRIAIIRSLGVIISLVVIVVCSYLLFNLFKDSVDIPLPGLENQQKTHVAPPESVSPAESSAQPDANSLPQPVSKVNQPVLPKLNDSDKEIREAASQLNPALKWAEWITTDEAIRKFVVVIDNLATGKISRKYLPIPKPELKFKSSQTGVKEYIDTRSFERYGPYISLFENIDNTMAAALYQHYSPLLEQAFAELGYTDRNFHNTLMQAFNVLLSAPIINADIELVRPSVFYKFADPELEQALPAHKQMIRMGPENARKLQNKIRQLQTALNPANQ